MVKVYIEVISIIGVCLTVCHCIRLPGIEDPHAPGKPALPPYIPLQDKVATDNYLPSNRNAISQLIAVPGTLNTVTETPKETTTTNTLIRLLDKLFGNRGWTALLAKLDDTPALPPPTASPIQNKVTSSTHELPGFYNHQVSASNVGEHRGNAIYVQSNHTTGPKTNSNASTNEKPEMMLSVINYLLKLKTETKFPGQHVVQEAHSRSTPSMEQRVSVPAFVPTQKPIDTKQWVNPTENTMYQHINMPASPAQTLKSFRQTDTNQDAYFNANQINEAQNTYNPNQPITAYQSQTGSNPYNVNLKTSYNADEVNQGYLQEVNNIPPGVGSASQAVFGTESRGYQFSAYQGSQPALFDPSSLNRAMFENRNLLTGNIQAVPNHGFPLGATSVNSSQDKVSLQSSQNAKPGQPNEHNGPKKNLTQKQTNITTGKPIISAQNSVPATVQFNFIPGNLFPGQTANSGLTKSGNVNSQVPSYLRNMVHNTGAQRFNPNALNQAQQLFNPNAASWLKTRSVGTYNPFDLQVEEESSGIPTTPTPSAHNTTSAVPLTAISNSVPNNTTTAMPRHTSTPSAGTTTASPSIITTNIEATPYPNNETGNTNYAGFDPNTVNAQQAQNGFVPGQMGPIMGNQGQNSNVYNNGKVNSNGLSNFGMNAQNQQSSGSALNFDMSNLLGMSGTGQNLNAGSQGNSGGSIGFNPNAWNNVQANVFSGGQNSTAMNSFGMNTARPGFDPNAANAGFGSVLGLGNSGQGNGAAGFGFVIEQNSNSTNGSSSNSALGFSMGGFDPNTANAGFGATDYGFAGGNSLSGSDTSSYIASFSPNAVNNIAIQNPFKSNSNKNSSNGNSDSLMNYFLGITSAQNGNGNSNGGKYESAFISGFNPDSVNQASYDPNKFNTIHMHFDPVEMLSKNPGLDKDALQNVNFDPNKVNSANTHISFSPIDMILTNPGMDRDMLANARYDPSKYPTQGQTGSTQGQTGSTQGQTGSTQGQTGSTQGQTGSAISQTGQNAYPDQHSAIFDPFDVMKKLMQSSSGFQPGSVGTQQMNFHPVSIFSKGNSGSSTEQSRQTTPAVLTTAPVQQTTSKPVMQLKTELMTSFAPTTLSTEEPITTTSSMLYSSRLSTPISGTITTTPLVQTSSSGTTPGSNG